MLRINKKYNFIDEVNWFLIKLEDDDVSMSTVSDETMRELMIVKNKYSLRDNIIISLLVDTGIRRTKLVMIKVKNIDFKNNYILLEHTKNKKKRLCFFTDETSVLLKEYVYNLNTKYLKY